MDSKDLQTRLASLSPAKRALLELKLKQGRTGIAENLTIPRRANNESAPLSFAQQRLWFLSRLEPESCVYNERSALRLDGALNLDALHRAINTIIARHEVLRTTYGMTDGGEPIQRIGEPKVIDLPVIDVSEVAEHRQDDEVQRIAAELRDQPFDLGKDFPMRLALIKLAPRCHVLIEVKHHIASDGWSSSVFARELAALYNCLSQRLPSPLPELPIQYADYAVWQREWLQGVVLEKQLAFWMAQLKEVQVLELPTDGPRRASSGNAGAKKFLKMSQSLIDRLQTLSRREGATLFMTLLAAFQVLLHRYTGQDDIAVGTPIAGRTRKETEGLVGFFVNTLVLRTKLQGNPSFRELLTRVREIALQAYEHQDLPFEKLVEELNPDRNQSQTPLFQVVFAVQNMPRSDLELSELKVSSVEIESSTAKFDISAAFVERDGEMNLRIEYRTDLFEAARIERMLGHFQNLLEGIVANPEHRISELPMLSEGEKHQLLFEWNDTQKEYPRDICIPELFEEQVEKTPDAVALVFEDQQLTYRELNNRANQLAHYLRKRGVGPNVLVGICLERSLELIVGLLGVLKAGGAYVPLDPTYPRERLLFMLEDSQVRVLITQEKYLSNLEYCTIVCLDRDWRVIANESGNNPQIQNGTGDLAYVIYTSGSTGKPKGTLISHRNVARLFDATEAWFHFDASDVWTLFHSYAFDFSVWEIWGALLYGGKLIIVTDETRRSPQEFTELLIEHHVTVLNQTPSAFRQLMPHLMDSKNRNRLDLRFVIFGGEALELQSLKSWFEFYGDENPQLINMYGITETTVHVTYRPIRRVDTETKAGSVIGKPIPDLKVYLLDKHRALVPIGVTGEIYVGGAGVAKGYLGRDELTAERFVAHPFSANPQTRLYRSGDLARWLPSGDLEYVGRVDDQVKIRGFRIELGEIESVLAQHPAIQQAVVLAREDTPGDKRLVAYVVAALGAIPLASDLRRLLQQRLPEYMVPSTILSLQSLPLTANGKVDRRALPMPDQSRPELDESQLAPRTPMEEIVVDIWARILKLDKVGIDDNFFDLGGHSLLATQVISRLNDAFSIDLQLRRLFETPTVAGLVAAIDACLRAKNDTPRIPPIVPRARISDAPLSFVQQHLWFLDQICGVPGIDGNTLGFADLARELGRQQPFYALEAVGLSGAEAPL
ncbi:MAG TPA: amino acid adenylation domain-containing protein, partial [Edaphobacter sp.]|nr:amino acid adenylation domain-containing protein [Edaphobacter sp.]